MIGLDTNVLVRFLVEDDPRQSKAAAALIEEAVSAGDDLFLSDIVLCETVWVLGSAYESSRDQIVETLTGLLRARNLAFESTDRLFRALDAYARGKGDFADYLIREHARSAGCDTVMTFDRPLLKEPGFSKP
jgi:predicted nucleic-acid-binding protein